MPLRLVHVSDIHFRGYGAGWDYDVDQRRELLRDVRELVTSDGKVDGILVGGDIAFRAAKAEYDAARHWLDDLREACGGLDTGRVWTVPGNHDVDWSIVGSSAVLKQFRQEARDCTVTDLDELLRERLSVDPAAAGMIAPLAEYDLFAGDYQCSVTCKQPHWYDATLDCDGLHVGVLGLNSVLISDQNDSDAHEIGKLVLGTWQCTVPRRDDTIHIVIAHHPPGWLRDWATVEPYLRRAHLLLFGHEHAYAARQPVDRGTVEVYAGAVGPERIQGMPTGRYAPTYNVLTLARADKNAVHVTVQPRYWDQAMTCFAQHPDGASQFYVSLAQPPGSESSKGNTGAPPNKLTPEGPPPRLGNPLAADTSDVSGSVTTPAIQAAAELRRIGSEYMRRPWTDRVEIARGLGVLHDHDLQMPDADLFPFLLSRIRDADLIPRLIEELDRA